MTNRDILLFLGTWVAILVAFLRQHININPRNLAIYTGIVLGFLWWLFSNVSWLNWILFLVGARPVAEGILAMLVKGLVAGFGSTFVYKALSDIVRRR